MSDQEVPFEPPSRSARKREAKSVEQLAADLVDLADAMVGRLPIADDLKPVLMQTRETKGHSSRKRQLKFFAGALRKQPEQVEALRAYLSGEHQQQRDDNRRTHQLEQLREQLCDPQQRSKALAQARQLLPRLDVLELERLVQNYRGVEDKKHYRLIFRCLRSASDAELEPDND